MTHLISLSDGLFYFEYHNRYGFFLIFFSTQICCFFSLLSQCLLWWMLFYNIYINLYVAPFALSSAVCSRRLLACRISLFYFHIEIVTRGLSFFVAVELAVYDISNCFVSLVIISICIAARNCLAYNLAMMYILFMIQF